MEQYIETHVVDVLSLSGDAVISPANRFGLMTGGIDLHYKKFFGRELEAEVQKTIVMEHNGELKVGQAFAIETKHPKIKNLIVAPTMRTPMLVWDTMNTYLAMKAALKVAKYRDFKYVLTPGLATGTGGMPWPRATIQMKRAIVEVL
jgi:O-acetyl-ADP-ribose deacetylase (regulator of RNase III)